MLSGSGSNTGMAFGDDRFGSQAAKPAEYQASDFDH